ncbi:hypothetical protein JDV02_007191 [Purpureocillium takamizusanense]|uniref:SnoaL-like domain-containing protein n=1 Tax=Purpureocillium takamizusanense TaxID=2060973 RepID=A0A9Q8QLZ9_9HYPO|nr:uncharacterized protein JDV02_007191 [Purpureocillium takamizusanense]UNI21179.1 hypothetical protein JDV02_007191 [Purpureocillium takamizusanense]
MAGGRVRITKRYIAEAFAPLANVSDPAARGRFFDYVVPDVTWAVAGTSHSLAGTRHTLRAHSDATFDRLGRKLRGPICFTVGRIVLDAAEEGEAEADEPEQEQQQQQQQQQQGRFGSDGGRWATVELLGVATRNTGEEYRNDYLWMTRWNDEGKMVEIKSYFDTYLSETVLNE